MPTLNKLEYLDETKQQIKTALNQFGSGITDEDTFRSYANKIDNIYNNWTKVTGTGESVTLNNTKAGKMSVIPGGNTSQETTEGVQLFDINDIANGYFINDVGQTNTSQNGFHTQRYIDVSDIDTLYLRFEALSNIKIGRLYIQEYDENYNGIARATSGIYDTTFSNGQIRKYSKTLDENAKYVRFSNYAIQELENGTYVSKTPSKDFWSSLVNLTVSKNDVDYYEPYTGEIPAPNPSYPQTVQVVKGSNSVKIINNLNPLDWEQGAISANVGRDYATCKTNNNYRIRTKNLIKLKTSENYIVDFNSSIYDVVIQAFNESQLLYTVGGVSNAWKTENFTFSTIPYIAVALRRKDGLEITTNELTDAKIKIYTESQTYPITLPTNMEMCKIGDYADEFVYQNSTWYKNKKIKKVIFNGTENWLHFSITEGDLFRLSAINDGINDNNYVPYCNAYKGIPLSQKSSRANYNFYIENDHIDIVDNRFTTTANFKANLVTNNISVYYPLATSALEPVEETTLINQLNAIKDAYSYQEQTNISQTNDDLPFIITASALMKGGN